MSISKHPKPNTPAEVKEAIRYTPASNVLPTMKPIDGSASTSVKGK